MQPSGATAYDVLSLPGVATELPGVATEVLGVATEVLARIRN